MWATAEPGFGSIEYFSDKQGFVEEAARVRTFHPVETRLAKPYTQFSAELSGLLPNTTYYYQSRVDGQEVGVPGRFRTPGDDPFKFVVIGDSGQATRAQVRIAEQVTRENPLFVIHTGDMAYGGGNFRCFQERYFDFYSSLMADVPFFPTPGNHDYEMDNAAAYLSVHSLADASVPNSDCGRYYSFDWGNVHFISLDSNLPLHNAFLGSDNMLRWLDADLRSTRQFWRVAFFHHPPYAGGPNMHDGLSSLARELISPILESNGVQLVLNGHEHSYQRSIAIREGRTTRCSGDGTIYVTSGGAGGDVYPVFPLPLIDAQAALHHYVRVEVQGARMTLSSIASDGAEIDRFVIAPEPALVGEKPVTLSSLNAGATIRIRGRNLSAAEKSANAPFPDTLSGARVFVNGIPIPLIYVRADEIAGQLPISIPPSFALNVTTENGFVEIPIHL